ncbi:MAG: 30S ribosomal protein S10 [Zestosphaera tikiterensis]|uniref:Small ribosomal subunit protein uS10 n=1 Tax=Zestosphaera tikiterensis TaxID=1973259 RepID=A0A2R7Y5L7_9CREN|nr:MAG: 30S ribosomal protein S10 [Zestosphaera tikiterensis]
MSSRVRIRLWSTNIDHLSEVTQQLVQIASKAGVNVRGPVPLPTKRLTVPVLRLPHGEGTKVYEKWQMRIHKRLIDIDADERVMRQIMRIKIPDDVYIEVELVR